MQRQRHIPGSVAGGSAGTGWSVGLRPVLIAAAFLVFALLAPGQDETEWRIQVASYDMEFNAIFTVSEVNSAIGVQPKIVESGSMYLVVIDTVTAREAAEAINNRILQDGWSESHVKRKFSPLTAGQQQEEQPILTMDSDSDSLQQPDSFATLPGTTGTTVVLSDSPGMATTSSAGDGSSLLDAPTSAVAAETEQPPGLSEAVTDTTQPLPVTSMVSQPPETSGTTSAPDTTSEPLAQSSTMESESSTAAGTGEPVSSGQIEASTLPPPASTTMAAETDTAPTTGIQDTTGQADTSLANPLFDTPAPDSEREAGMTSGDFETDTLLERESEQSPIGTLTTDEPVQPAELQQPQEPAQVEPEAVPEPVPTEAAGPGQGPPIKWVRVNKFGQEEVVTKGHAAVSPPPPEVAPTPTVAAQPEAEEQSRQTRPSRKSASIQRDRGEIPSPTPPGELAWRVQIMALSQSPYPTAEQEARSAERDLGIPVRVKVTTNGVFLLQVGEYRSRADAERALPLVQQLGYPDAFLVHSR